MAGLAGRAAEAGVTTGVALADPGPLARAMQVATQAVPGVAVAGAPEVRAPRQVARAASQAVRGPLHRSREPPPPTPAEAEAVPIRAVVDLAAQVGVGQVAHPLLAPQVQTVKPTPVAVVAAVVGQRRVERVAPAWSSFVIRLWRPSQL